MLRDDRKAGFAKGSLKRAVAVLICATTPASLMHGHPRTKTCREHPQWSSIPDANRSQAIMLNQDPARLLSNVLAQCQPWIAQKFQMLWLPRLGSCRIWLLNHHTNNLFATKSFVQPSLSHYMRKGFSVRAVRCSTSLSVKVDCSSDKVSSYIRSGLRLAASIWHSIIIE
jgi:hypothetical protein